MFAGCGEQARGAAKPWKPSCMGSFCRVHEETIETSFFRSMTTILPTKRPPFWSPKRTPNGVHSLSLNLICLCPGDLAPALESVFPKRGSFCRQIFAAGRKIVQVSIVSAGTRQRFCIPLGRWVSMVLQRHEHCSPRPAKYVCLHIFLNCMQEACNYLGINANGAKSKLYDRLCSYLSKQFQKDVDRSKNNLQKLERGPQPLLQTKGAERPTDPKVIEQHEASRLPFLLGVMFV